MLLNLVLLSVDMSLYITISIFIIYFFIFKWEDIELFNIEENKDNHNYIVSPKHYLQYYIIITLLYCHHCHHSSWNFLLSATLSIIFSILYLFYSYFCYCSVALIIAIWLIIEGRMWIFGTMFGTIGLQACTAVFMNLMR